MAAKEQLAEEEAREVAQGLTERIKADQLQKDGLLSVTARRKKAFAQLEESEKAVKLMRKALQRAQEDLEQAQQQHAAAQEACASVEKEIDEEEEEDEECMHVGEQETRSESYQDWYNPSDRSSQSAEIQEVRTAVSQISATLALLVKALPPGILETGTSFSTATDSDASAGSAFGGHFKLWRPSRALRPRLRADSEEEKANQLVNPVEEAANALQPFRSATERHKPY